MVAQGLSCPGGNIDYLWNRNKPFPSEKEHLVESPEKLTWIGDFGFVAQEPWPGNIFVDLELPPVHEDPGLPNLQLPGSEDHYRTSSLHISATSAVNRMSSSIMKCNK